MQTNDSFAVEVRGLYRSFGTQEAVHNLDLTVAKGQCHGLFGRNGAGKTTTMKCLLHQLRPDRGTVRVFGMDPQVDEVGVKSRLGYVPEDLAFYPWMTVRRTLDYAASFRRHWNRELEHELLRLRFELDERARVASLSKGMRAQLALVCAICPEPDLLVLDEPTSGLDPVVRREFIETVIGAYQEGHRERTVLVSTHLIAEFEGLIDAFTVIENGRRILSQETDAARSSFKKIRLLFADEPPPFTAPQVLAEERSGREVNLVVRDFSPGLEHQLRAHKPTSFAVESLPLEEMFVALTRNSENPDRIPTENPLPGDAGSSSHHGGS